MPDELSGSAVREAADALLEDPAYRNAACDVASEIAGMPSAADVADRLSA